MKKRQQLYEQFHQVTKKHSRLIQKTDFTHKEILRTIDFAIQDLVEKERDPRSLQAKAATPRMTKAGRKKDPRSRVSLGSRMTATNSELHKVSILDLGCGTGSISLYYGHQGYQVTGIDISQKAIKSCKENAQTLGIKTARFFVSTVEDFNPKEKFDVVLLLEVIEHLENDEEVLKKVKAILKPKGLLVLSTPSIQAPLYRLGLLDEFDKRVGHLRRYDLAQIQRLVKRSGFELVLTKKYEGILRNFMFNISLGTWLLKAVNRSSFLNKIVTEIDQLLVPVFGESDYIVVARKV